MHIFEKFVGPIAPIVLSFLPYLKTHLVFAHIFETLIYSFILIILFQNLSLKMTLRLPILLKPTPWITSFVVVFLIPNTRLSISICNDSPSFHVFSPISRPHISTLVASILPTPGISPSLPHSHST
jgi:hypothetical protein